jgi:ribosome maturation factor RimP
LFIRNILDLVQKIRKLAEEHLKSSNEFIVEVIVSARKTPARVLVILDSDSSIGIDDCAEFSRRFSKTLDESGLIEDKYMLEVSTPGLDHPLKLTRQYFKNIGRGLKVKTKTGVEEGKLETVDEEGITLRQSTGKGKKVEENVIRVPFTEIDKTFVLVSFK